MKIAIVTGASSGIGASYVCQLAEKYSWLDEIWVIARNETALWTLKRQCIVPLRVFAMDITQTENLLRLEEELEKVKPYVKYFVNAAGCGINKKIKETDLMDCKLQCIDPAYENCTSVLWKKKQNCYVSFCFCFFATAGICCLCGVEVLCA